MPAGRGAERRSRLGLGRESARPWQPEPVPITASLTPAELQAAGLYDPDAPGADHQLYLLTVILERGGTLEQMISAAAHGRLARLAAETLFLPSYDRFTVDQAAAKTGVDAERIRALWPAAGFPELANDDPRLTPWCAGRRGAW